MNMDQIIIRKLRNEINEVATPVVGDIPELRDSDILDTDKNIVIITSQNNDNLVMDNLLAKGASTISSEIDQLDPSIAPSLLPTVNVEDNCEPLGVISDIVKITVPSLVDWPPALSEKDLLHYYENSLLDGLEEMEELFMRESNPEMQTLMNLVERWEQSVNRMLLMKDDIRVERRICDGNADKLWCVDTKTGSQEVTCMHDTVTRKTYVYDEAVYDVLGSEQLKQDLHRLEEEVIEKVYESRYETTVNKALVENYLSQVRVASDCGDLRELRQCITVLFLFLRRASTHDTCLKGLRDWIVYLGNIISSNGDFNDRLYLLWQLLHSPAGVSEWGLVLVHLSNDERELDLVVAYLVMILMSGKHRKQLLHGYNPGNNSDEETWTLLDSEGEEDRKESNNWSLLKESDLIGFMNQVPIKSVFKFMLALDPCDDRNEICYDKDTSCYLNNLLRLMGFCYRMIAVLNRGLYKYDLTRYKTFSRRICRLINETIQFLTDYLEAMPSNYMLPAHHEYFLTQYETVFDSALVSILRHSRHGNWQCLVDLRWRLLSPSRKQSALFRLIDPHNSLSSSTEMIDLMVSSLQSTIKSAHHNDVVHLLTSISNLALDCQLSNITESTLISTIVRILFNVSYVDPVLQSSISKVNRELLFSICLQHTQALSFILDSVKLWHSSIDEIVLSLFRELPFSLMIPTDSEFELLQSWILDRSPSTVCNRLARHVLTHLNWGFADTKETNLYLPLYFHRRMADLIVDSYMKHTINPGSGQWLRDNTKLITSLSWNQESTQEPLFHTWCLRLAIRLRLHQVSRTLIPDENSLTIDTSTLIHRHISISETQQSKRTNPVAMFMTLVLNRGTKLPDVLSLNILRNLIVDQQQYRVSLELISNDLLSSDSSQLNCICGNETFVDLWRQLIHADDTSFSVIKTIIGKQVPGPVLSCIGHSFCPSLIIANGNSSRQETLMQFFLRLVLSQPDWITDYCCLWLLDTLLCVNTSLGLKAGDEELHNSTKLFTEKQLQAASRKSSITNIFRISGTFNSLVKKLSIGDYLWVQSYIIEAQAKIEDDLMIWPNFVGKISMPKKKSVNTVATAMVSACKSLKWALTFGHEILSIIEAAELLATCPVDHFAFVKIATVFYSRYLGLASLWDETLAQSGSVGNSIFQDETCNYILKDVRTNLSSTKKHFSSELDSMQQNKDKDSERLSQLQNLCGILNTLILWLDEPQLHLKEFPISRLRQQYRPDLLQRIRSGMIISDDLGLPRKIILRQIQTGASLWTCRHNIDPTFSGLTHDNHRGTPVSVSEHLFHRFKEDGPIERLPQSSFDLFEAPVIPRQALTNSSSMLECIGDHLSTMHLATVKYTVNKNVLRDLDKEYLTALSHYYRPSVVTEPVHIPCARGNDCYENARFDLKYQMWSVSEDIVATVTRNRQDYNSLVDEMTDCGSVDELVKTAVYLHNLITDMGQQLRQSSDEDEMRKVVECGMTLFFHIGQKITPETQTYPPHRCMVISSVGLLGTIFVQYLRDYAQEILQCMLKNVLLVEIYGPHLRPNVNDPKTANLYSQVVNAYNESKCTSDVTSVILSKFEMRQFVECAPRLASIMPMVCALCDALGAVKVEGPGDNNLEIVHAENLGLLLSYEFTKCVPIVLGKYLILCQESRLGPHLWQLLLRCTKNNIEQYGELSLTIEDIKKSLELFGCWLNSALISDRDGKIEGLYFRYGRYAVEMTQVYGLLLGSLMFKMCRSATNDSLSWHEVISVGWDFVKKIYSPWLQALPLRPGQSHTNISPPWRLQDKDCALNMAELLVTQLNSLITYISNELSQGSLLNCVLSWIIKVLLGPQQWQSSMYEDVYCSTLIQVHWGPLSPTVEGVRLILEFFARSNNTEQSMGLVLGIASQIFWSKIAHLTDSVLKGLLFEMVVAMVCRTRTVFTMEAMGQLADGLMLIGWNELSVMDYKRGMDQLSVHLQPRVILLNTSTIEGKVVKLLGDAAGQIITGDIGLGTVVDKMAIYINAMIKLLSLSFALTQEVRQQDNDGMDESQLRLFHLLTEMETITNQVKDGNARHNLALCILAEILVLFTNNASEARALDPVINWIRESRSSYLIVPFLECLYRWPPNVTPMVKLAHELIVAHLLSDGSDAGQESWTTITIYATLSPNLEEAYLLESVRHNCVMCLVQQTLLALPLIKQSNSERWQTRIVAWLQGINPGSTVSESGTVILLFLYLQLFLSSSSTNPRPGPSFEGMIDLLLKLSQSGSGLLSLVGIGTQSSHSIEFRVLCRSMVVFLQSQVPSNNILRTMPHQPGGLTNPNMIITSSRLPGQPLPTNRTFQNLEILKSQRHSNQVSASIKPIIEMSIGYICDPGHCVMDSVAFMRLLCRRLWPQERLLALIHIRSV